MRIHRSTLVAAVTLLAVICPLAASAAPPAPTPVVNPNWVTGLGGGSGSAVGPDGALYVPEPNSGHISRVDPDTGARTTFASCLPPSVIGLGGAMDVAFIGNTLYALVTLVSDPAIGAGPEVDGIYRVDGPNSCIVVADIGAYAAANPPDADIFLVTGVQYAMEPYRGGFLVTDGHHNRVYRVTRKGEVSVFRSFGNVVPTGLAVRGNTVYMAEAGPVSHAAADGKVVSFEAGSTNVTQIAYGAPLLVDVEFGRGRTLFALSQGPGQPNAGPGSPAEENTGSLVSVNGEGMFTVVGPTNLNRPTSLEIIKNTAYIVTLNGTIIKIDGISGPPYGSPS